MAYLTVVDGPDEGTQYEFTEECVLGRALDCQVQIQDLTVSRRHARITKVIGGYEVADLGSGNGTYVNENAVTKHLLDDDDVVRVSNLRLRFCDGNRALKTKVVEGVTMLHSLEGLMPNIVQTVDAKKSIIDAAELASDPAQIEKTAARLRTIYAISQDIANILDLDDLLTEIVDRLFSEFEIAHTGFIMLYDDSEDQLTPKAIKRREGYAEGEITVSSTIINQVLQQKQAVLSRDAMHDERFLSGQSVAAIGIRSMMCAPLVWRGESLGVIYLDSFIFDAFNELDLELLNGIAGQASLAIGNARLHEQLMKRQRFEQDLKMAERIQQSFLPRRIPDIPGFTFCTRYDPAFEIGGDFYDFIRLPNDRLGIVVGDVSGKGVAAALYMAKMSRDLRYFALAESSPGRVLSWMNRAVLESGQDDIFVTLIYSVLETKTGKLLIANAGHMPAMVREAHAAKVRTLDKVAGMPLGVMPDVEYEYETFQLKKGDTILMYSDGLVEAMSPQREMYGMERLQRCLFDVRESPENLLEDLLTDMQSHVSGAPQFDDTTILCLGRT